MWGLKREYYRCDICGRECEAPPTISCDWCQRNICKECLAWEKAPSMKYQEKYRQDPGSFLQYCFFMTSGYASFAMRN